MSNSHLQVFEELKRLTCEELKSSDKLVELITTKLNLISTSSVVSLHGYDELQEWAGLFLHAVQDVLSDRYQALSIRCFAHLCVALDYLIDPHDSVRDTDPGGHADDREFLIKTATKFKEELNRYKDWRNATGNKW